MNIDRSKHNKYTAGAVYGNLTTGGISTDEVGNVTGTGLLYSGNIIYVGGGGGSIDPALMEKMLNQNAYSYMNIGNGVNTERTEAKQEKDYINLNIVGDHETVDTEISKDRYLNKTLFDATGLKGGRYGVTYKKILVPGEASGEPVEIPKWVITLEKIFGNPIFSELDFNGVQIFNGNVEVGVYSINNPKVTVNQDNVTGLVSIVISNPEPLDFTELRIIKAGEYIDTTTFSNIAIISNIVILEYVTVTITLAGATKYWKIDDQGRLYTTYNTYTTKSLGAYDKIWTNYGYTVGNYVLGLSGGAFYITDKLQNTYLEVDKLKVRKKAYFETLEIVNVNSVGGKLIISPAGAVTVNKVEDKGTYYRCYFLGVQDGVEVENRFKKDDLAFSLNFNIKKPGEYEQVANHYFWRKVNAVSVEPDANGNHWIDLDKIDCDTDSDIPHINDVVAQLGNKTDTDRLSAMIFSSVDAESPRIILCHGINTYSLSSKEYFDLGVNHLTNLAYMNVYGNSFVGARDGSTYVKYTLTDGLQIKGKISASSTYGDKAFSEVFVTTENFDDSVKAVIGADLEFLQNLIDGNIESYFYEYSPTLTNYPANTWLTTADKLRHNGDTFTNIQKYVNDATTPDAGKSWRWVKNASNVWGWTPISDSDAVLALKKAGEALDTADGKRRVFTRKPETADIYDIGDLWVNATYTDTVGLMVYSNDLLRAKKAKVKGIAFNITDWELASKYTDDTAANAAKQDAAAALAAATAAGAAATAALTTINNYKDTIDDVFQDGIITASEKNRLNSLRDTVNTTLFDVLTTYNKVYHNINLESTVLKTRLKTAYDTFSIAAKALVDAVTTILTKVVNSLYSITKGDIATIDNAYTNFNTKYTDYVGALGDANLQITTAIGNTSYTNAVNKYAWLNGLFDPNLTTTIEGGVVTTGVLALGKTTLGVFKVNAGINGVSNTSYVGGGPAIWFGGDMLDKDNYSAGNRPDNVATSMFRYDGSGYLGYKPNKVAAKDQASIWWDATGNIHANPLSFFVGEETVGLLLASFLAVDSTGDGLVDYIVQKAPFTYLQIGNGYIGYDAANNAVYVYVLDSSGNKLICNFYAYGEVSAYGGDSSGEPPAGALYLDELKDVQFTSLTSGQILGYNGSKWVNIDKPASGASSWADITGKPTTLAGYGITDIHSYAPSLTGSNASGYWNITSARASSLSSTYTGSGGAQPPSYFNGLGLKVNMMNIPIAYCDVIVVNGYAGTGSDVPYINAIAFYKTGASHGNVYHAGGGYGASSWSTWHAFLDSYNYNSYSPTLTGKGASGTWGISITGNLAATNPQLGASYESNEIAVIDNTGVNKLNHAIRFRWYANYYQLGIVRDSGTGDSGFAICRDTTPLVKFQPSVLSAMTTIQATVKNSIQADGVILVNANSLANNNYTEGIRMIASPNGWSNIHFNTAPKWEGFQAGQWLIGRNPGNAFIIATAGQEPSANTWREGSVLIDSSSNLNAKSLTARNGLLQSICYGNVVTIGSQNNGWCHFQSTLPYYFNMSVAVAGDVYPYNANANSSGRDGVRWSSVWTNNVQFYPIVVASTWANILRTGAGLNANTNGIAEYVPVNTDQLILRWQNVIPAGYRTTYGISSVRGTSGYGEMRIFVAGSDPQTGGRALRLSADGSMAWEGSFTNGNNGLTCGYITASGNIVAGGRIHTSDYNNTAYKMSTGSFICNSWIRTVGATGWYNETYGGGIYMEDGTYVKVYNNKKFYVSNIEHNGVFINGGYYSAWDTSGIDTWSNTLEPTRAIFNSYNLGMAANTVRNIIGWADTINGVGFTTRYSITSGRAASGWGSMRLSVGNNDAGNSGHQLSINGNGVVYWTGIFASITNGITSTFGAQNSSFCHIYTTAPLFYMDKGLSLASLSSRGAITASGYIKAENGYSVRYDKGSWLSMATRGTCIVADQQNSPDGAHSLFRTQWTNGYVMAYGGLNDMMGFFAYSATNIANGINGYAWATYWSSAGILTHNGSFVASGEVTAYSDIRLKSNITNLSFRGKLTPKTYIKDGKQSIGFIAQEVQQLYPELISVGSDENHYLSLNYGCITAVLSSQINKVEDEVYVLKNRIKQLEDKLKVYESRVSTFI